MRRIRIPGLPPFGPLSTFPETNIRTYIVDPNGRRGVWFFSLDITRLLPAINEPPQSTATRGNGLVAATSVPGLVHVIRDRGAVCVPCSESAAPSTREFVDAARISGASTVLLLPSDPDSHASAALAAHELQGEGIAAHVIGTCSDVETLAVLAVVEPSMNGIGGDGFWLVREPNKRVRAIMAPAAVATWLFGALTAWAGGYFEVFPGWLAVKLAGLAGLTLVHLWLARVVAEMAADRRRHGHRVFRMVNEIPTVLLIVIVMMAVVRPGLWGRFVLRGDGQLG